MDCQPSEAPSHSSNKNQASIYSRTSSLYPTATPTLQTDTIMQDVEIIASDDVTRPTFDKFHLFLKVPIELRLKIWGDAAPEPAVIVQRESGKVGRQFRYIRSTGIPSVLHACHESRTEYLDSGIKDETLARRKMEHSVYKLCFGNKSGKACQVFWSEVDSLWALRHKPRGMEEQMCTNILTLGPLTGLKRLMLSCFSVSPTTMDLREFASFFPSLETLTILIPEKVLQRESTSSLELKPETYGEVSTHRLIEPFRGCVRVLQRAVNARLAQAKKKSPKSHFPTIKYRMEGQFKEKEYVTIPPRAVKPRRMRKKKVVDEDSEGDDLEDDVNVDVAGESG
ncbi:uncharacterized protein PAC_02459 [Phialocephala subalpina]|uniref:2EXR domain-containing protein n=1 Tax=Phialocephala subalpina TaxID=576137 RepID=A0A1L7WIH6_9HELO|nr:uncharacterized protein PAC_02459 [Phialocephala subalpina]